MPCILGGVYTLKKSILQFKLIVFVGGVTVKLADFGIPGVILLPKLFGEREAAATLKGRLQVKLASVNVYLGCA